MSDDAARLPFVATPMRTGELPAAQRLHRVAWGTSVLLLALLCMAPAACRDTSHDTFGSSVTPMDHDPSDTFVRQVYIDGHWVGSAGMGGSTVAGGISLPRKWRPGLTAVVRWERCDRYDEKIPVPDEEACRWTEKVVPIHQYDEVGHTDVHILEGYRVLIIPTMLDPTHPDYPGPGYPTKNFFKDFPYKDPTDHE